MVEIGSVIEAQVERVEPYGIFLRHADAKAFVHLPEVSWTAGKPLAERFQVGDVLRVLALRYDYPDRILVGSLRRLQPEKNPYRKLSKLPPGRILEGEVKFVSDQDLTVKLRGGAWGLAPTSGRSGRHFRIGQKVKVVIAALEVDEGRLSLELASESSSRTSKKPRPFAVRT